MVPVDVLGIQLANEGAAPLVLLRELDAPHRIVPLSVGGNEALAIAIGLQGVETPRPLTHDLLIDVLARTDTTVGHVVISGVHDGTFRAELALAGPQGDRTLDSRPSDAIALAVRLDAPLFMDEAVLDEVGLVPVVLDELDDAEDGDAEGDGDGVAPGTAAEREQLVAGFRQFLDEVDPGDFAAPPA